MKNALRYAIFTAFLCKNSYQKTTCFTLDGQVKCTTDLWDESFGNQTGGNVEKHENLGWRKLGGEERGHEYWRNHTLSNITFDH